MFKAVKETLAHFNDMESDLILLTESFYEFYDIQTA